MTIIAKLTAAGVARVLSGAAGMTFIVDSFGGIDDRCANVRDYRYPQVGQPFQIWTLGLDDYELLEGGADLTLEVRKTFTCMRQIADDLSGTLTSTTDAELESHEQFYDRLRGQATALEQAFSSSANHTILAGGARATAILIAAVAEAPELQQAIDYYRLADLTDEQIVERIRRVLSDEIARSDEEVDRLLATVKIED